MHMEEERKTFKERYGFKFSPKFGFTLGGVGMVFIFIFVSFLWDLNFGKFDLGSWLADSLILMAIMISMMVLVDLLAQEYGMERYDGLYQQNLSKFNKSLSEISDIRIYYGQYFIWFLQKETRNKRIEILMQNSIDPREAEKIVDYATLDMLDTLVRRTVKVVSKNNKEVVIRKITDEQREIVYEVLHGEWDIKRGSYSQYLFADTEGEAVMSILERNDYLEERRKESKKWSYIIKIGIFLIFTLIFAALIPDSEEGAGVASKLWVLFKRLSTAVGGFLSGWMSGTTDVKYKAKQLLTKAEVNECFKANFDKKNFVPKSEEELDRELYEEAEREEKEAAEAVITPETIKAIAMQ